MVLFTILTLTLIMSIVFAIIAVSIGGVAFFAVFGDVILCGVIIGLIVGCLVKRRRK